MSAEPRRAAPNLARRCQFGNQFSRTVSSVSVGCTRGGQETATSQVFTRGLQRERAFGNLTLDLSAFPGTKHLPAELPLWIGPNRHERPQAPVRPSRRERDLVRVSDPSQLLLRPGSGVRFIFALHDQ